MGYVFLGAFREVVAARGLTDTVDAIVSGHYGLTTLITGLVRHTKYMGHPLMPDVPTFKELGVDWVTDLLQFMWKNNYTRAEATPEAEAEWGAYVQKLYGMLLMRKAQGWFTGYNSNVEGHEQGKIRYLVFNGGTPKFRAKINEAAEQGYSGINFS